MKKWNELSMADRAKYIKLGVEQGITSIKDISSAYNSYADGGYKGDENNSIELPEFEVTANAPDNSAYKKAYDEQFKNGILWGLFGKKGLNGKLASDNPEAYARFNAVQVFKDPEYKESMMRELDIDNAVADDYIQGMINRMNVPIYTHTESSPEDRMEAWGEYHRGSESEDEHIDIYSYNKQSPVNRVSTMQHELYHASDKGFYRADMYPGMGKVFYHDSDLQDKVRMKDGVSEENAAYLLDNTELRTRALKLRGAKQRTGKDYKEILNNKKILKAVFGRDDYEDVLKYDTDSFINYLDHFVYNDYDKSELSPLKAKFGGKINRFDEEGYKTTLDSFRESLMPVPMDEYIRNSYGYMPYKVPKEIEDSVPVRNNKVASVNSKNNSSNNIISTKAEPDNVEVSVSKPGTYFPREWKDRPKSTIDSSGNYHTDLPDVYRIDDRPLTFGDRLYRTVNSVMDVNPITSSTRVKNMQKADMRNYWDISPRQSASGLSTIGNFLTYIPEPHVRATGYILQAPDLIYDSYDAVSNPSWKNTASVLGDVAGINKLTKYVKPFKLPSFNIPTYTFTDGEGNRLFSFPGGTIGGQTVNPMYLVNLLKGYGMVEDVLNTFGLDFPTFEKAEDPDTIRIHQTPQGGYGEYIHTPWEEFNEKKDNKYKEGGKLNERKSDRERIAEIVASNPAFASVNVDEALANYLDSKAERNITELPELTVTATKKNNNTVRRIKAYLPSQSELNSIIKMMNQQEEDSILSNISPQNLITKRKLQEADAKTSMTSPSGTNIMEHIATPIMNLYMPSQWVGAAFDAANGRGGFWESLGYGNSGFVPNEWANEHPYWTMAINAVGDIGTTGLATNISDIAGFNSKQFISNKAKQFYRTPRTSLGNKSIRSFLKPFTKDLQRIDTQAALDIWDNNIASYIRRRVPNSEVNVRRGDITVLTDEIRKNDFIDRPVTFLGKEGYIREYNKGKNRFYTVRGDVEGTPYIDIMHDYSEYTIPYSDNNVFSREIQKKVDKVNEVIGDSGIMGGSSVIYGKNFSQGIPNDLEIVTTPKRVNTLAKKLETPNLEKHGDFGYRANSSLSYNNEPIDIQVIQETADGMAYGPLAHEYYKLLYPKEYKKIIDEAVKSSVKNNTVTLDNITFPISAEDLYKQITPEVQERKLLQDMFLSDKDKHVVRAYQMLTNPDASIRSKARQSMKDAIRTHFDDYKLASEEYTNLKFDNVEANETFLRYLNLPLEYAENEDIMRNIVDRWHIANTTQSRNVFKKRGERIYISDMESLDKAINTTYAPYNGSFSGIGGNTVVYSGKGGVGGDFGGVLQQRLTLQPERIRTPRDLILQKQALNTFDYDSRKEIYNQLSKLEDKARAGKITENELQEEQLRIAKENDIPMYIGTNYRDDAVYEGNIIRPVNSRIYPIEGNIGMFPEVGGTGLPLDKGWYDFVSKGARYDSGISLHDRGYYRYLGPIEDKYEDIVNTVDEASRKVSYKSYDKRHRKLTEFNDKISRLKYRKRDIKDNAITYSKALGAISLAPLGIAGIVKAGQAIRSDIEQKNMNYARHIDSFYKNEGKLSQSELNNIKEYYGLENESNDSLIRYMNKNKEWILKDIEEYIDNIDEK